MKLTNFTDPQKRPYGVKGASHRVKNGQKFLVKIDIKFIISWNSDEKIRTRISEDSLGPKFMILHNFGVGRNFCGQERIFEILGLWVKNFQKFQIFKNLKKHHFSTFVVFLLLFGQSGLSCPHLPNFASQKFLGAFGVPWQNLKNWKKLTSLKWLKWQKFLSGVEHFSKT